MATVDQIEAAKRDALGVPLTIITILSPLKDFSDITIGLIPIAGGLIGFLISLGITGGYLNLKCDSKKIRRIRYVPIVLGFFGILPVVGQIFNILPIESIIAFAALMPHIHETADSEPNDEEV